MNEHPDFSVVISAYNKAGFLGEAIKSVLAQTCPDFELIIIDDGSTDNTKGIVDSFSDKRIRYYYQENSGLPASARNKGMSLARGKYIALLDADDFWYKDKLARCKTVLDENKDIALVCHNEAVVYGNRVLRHTRCGPYVDDMYSRILFKGNCLHPSAVALRHGIFFDDQMHFTEEKSLFAIEDYEYWLQLSRRYKFCFLNDILGCYRINEEGIFLRNIERTTPALLNLLNYHFSRIPQKTLSQQILMRRRLSAVMSSAGRLYQHRRQFAKAREWYIKAIKEYPFNYKARICYLAALLNIRIIYR